MRQEDDYRRGRHVVSALNVQLVLVTECRCGVLTGEGLGTICEVFASACADFGVELVELDGEDDHVHLIAAYPPHAAVDRLVSSLKGVSARRLRQQYRVRTPGSTCVAVVVRGLGWWRTAGDLRAYIRQQRTPGRPG